LILITGGAGYIGSHTNKILSEKGYKTVVFDNLERGNIRLVKWGEFVLGDTSDREQLELVFATYPIEAVFYFAAFAYVGESVQDPQKYYKNNLQFTITLLEVMQKYGVKILFFPQLVLLMEYLKKYLYQKFIPKTQSIRMEEASYL
jgi:UDP-glucose 4-epimerase